MPGPARCIVEDPQSGPTAFDVAEIDAQGVVLRTPRKFSETEYLDVALELASAPPQALFAQVVGNDNGVALRLRWLHMDPSEEQALNDVLDHWRAGDFDEVALGEDVSDALDIFGEAPDKEKPKREGTRRITRPNLKPVTGEEPKESKRHKTVSLEAKDAAASTGENKNKTVRFEATPMENRVLSDDIADAAQPEAKSGTRRVVRPDKAPTEDSGAQDIGIVEGTKRKTRRITRPGDKPPEPKPAAKNTSAPGEESGAHNVVVTNTRRFNKIKSNQDAPEKNVTPQSVRGDDGKLDVGASIRNSAKTVSAAELAERHDKLKVLNMRTIKTLIQDAVKEAVEQLGGALDAKEKDSLLKEAEDNFKERLEAFKAEKKGLESQAGRLREQLDRAQELLEEEKKRKIEKDQFTVSDSGIADLEKQFERMVGKAARGAGVNDEFEDQLRMMVNTLLDDERKKIAEQAEKAQGEAIELLERKVKRLAGTLEDTEKERDAARRHANELAVSGGGGGPVQNMYDVGLAADDANKEAKLALLKDIFAQNQEMRDHLKKSGKKLQHRKRPPKPKVEAKEEDAVAAPAEEEVPAAAEPSAEPAIEAAETAVPADDGEITNPDDMPWEPGKNYNPEADFEDDNDGDDEEDSVPVKKIVVADVEPPKLQRKKKSKPAATDADDAPAEDTSADASEADSTSMDGNPDDMPWEPPSASDADDEEEGGSSVKKMSIKTDFEPPPLRRKKS